MTTVFLVFHVTACIFLIFIVLVQGGKGAELGAAFGGSSQTLFGSRGAATFLNKMTTVIAIVFMLTSFTLSFLSTKEESVVRQQTMPKASRQMPGSVPAQGGQPQGTATPQSSMPATAPAQGQPVKPLPVGQPAK